MLLGQVVEPLIVRDNALQCPITSIGIRLTAMEAGYRPRGDTHVVDDWDHNNTPGPLAFRTSTKFGDNQPLDLILGLRELFHNPHSHRLGSRTNCRLSICGVTEGKSQGSSVAKVVARPSLHRGYGTEFAGGADQFGDPLAPLRRWLDLAVGTRRRPLVIAPQPTRASCVGNNGETQLKRAVTQGVGIVSNLSRSKRGGGLACSRCGAAMDEVVRIAPLPGEPGLIAYECPGCGYVTSVLSHPDGEQ